ncbi:MAG: peptide-binding protein [Candidatus Omnitrophota bacterium]
MIKNQSMYSHKVLKQQIKNNKKVLFLAVLFLFCLLINACSGEKEVTQTTSRDENAPSYGDTIVEASIADARNLLPLLASDSASSGVCGLVFNGLVKYDKDLNLIGDLAQKWEVQNQGLTIIFYLRQGVKWHDGVKLTARDVEFTYQSLINPQVRTPYSGDFKKVKSLEIIDDYTIKITYEEPFSPGLSSWGMGVIPEHLLKDEDLNNTSFSRNPVGTGPYKFVKWKTQEQIVLDVNPDYFEGRPFIERCIFRIIPDSTTMFLELQNLSIDYMGLSPLQFMRQTDSAFFKTNYQKFNTQGFNFTYLGYNLENEKFKDVRIRQALNYAVDKQEIINGVLLGQGRECTGPFAPKSWAYNQAVKALRYNPEKALELLKECGWKMNPDHLLEKEGKLFEFTIITNQGNEQRQQTAEIIQKRLANIGIKVKIKIVEWNAFINEFINKRKFETILLGWGLSLDPDLYDIWHSSKTKEGEFNFISYENKQVDALIEQGRREFNQEKRKQLSYALHEIIYREQPYMFLYTPDSLPIVSSRFKGIKVAPAGITYNFIKWFVPKHRQKYILQ